MTSRRPVHSPAIRRAAVLALLWAFVLAQALGWIHRSVHADAGSNRLTATAPQAPADTDGHAQGPFDALFGNHADASDCRLFDVLAQPGCASATVPVLPALPTAAFLLSSHGSFVARWSALFDARGPPSSR